MTAKLTATQATILETAAGRPDGNIEPLPPTLRGGARTKVIEGLIARGLVVSAPGQYLLTDVGYAAVSRQRPAPMGVGNTDAPDGVQNLDTTPRSVRPGTRLADLIDWLRQPGGATIIQRMATTHWQAHTIRGAISSMVKKKLGHNVVSGKGTDGDR